MKNRKKINEYIKIYAQSRMKKLRFLLGNKCNFCGWNKFPEVLEFAHKHKYNKQKNFKIASNIRRKMTIVMAETKKCFLLCPTCHTVYDRKLSTAIRSPLDFVGGDMVNCGKRMSREKTERNELLLKARKNGLSYRKIAIMYGINVKSVFRIVNRLTVLAERNKIKK